MYKIEKNVEIPDSTQEKSEMRKFMESMEVGDSFYVKTIAERNKIEKMRAVLNGLSKFSIRKFDGGFRCWRLK